jgi:UDPglucose 6-dehydrogenase
MFEAVPHVTRICCVGAGHVGGPSMAVIAQRAPDILVTVVDADAARIAAWQEGPLPIHEPGLDEIVAETRGRNLFFSTDMKPALAEADIIFVAVNTPTKRAGIGAGGAADLRHVEAVARLIAAVTTTPKIIVEKSTVPVMTAAAIQRILAADLPDVSCPVLSNPEFLAGGTAIHDLQHPDRILIGGDDTPEAALAIAALASIYARWIARDRIVITNRWTAELAKLVANAFLAQRLSSINTVAALCEATGADVGEVADAIGRDMRIGPRFLAAAAGFGGACFRRDISNLVYLCEHYQLPVAAAYWEQVVRVNEWHKRRLTAQIVRTLGHTVVGKRIAVLGFAFKADTNDTRESPAIDVVRDLLAERAEVVVYDPRVTESQIRVALHHEGADPPGLGVAPDAAAAALGAHALVVLTEWPEFAWLDYAALFAGMMRPAFVFDGRNVLDLPALRALGFQARGIGKSEPAPAAKPDAAKGRRRPRSGPPRSLLPRVVAAAG